jgi:hypothetical protein
MAAILRNLPFSDRLDSIEVRGRPYRTCGHTKASSLRRSIRGPAESRQDSGSGRSDPVQGQWRQSAGPSSRAKLRLGLRLDDRDMVRIEEKHRLLDRFAEFPAQTDDLVEFGNVLE